MTTAANNEQRVGALFGLGRRLSDTPRGRAVASVLMLRCQRAWVTPGAYAWWRFNDDIERAQQRLAGLRQTGSSNDYLS